MPVNRIDELIPPYPGNSNNLGNSGEPADKPLINTDYSALFKGLNVDGKLGQQALLHAPESGVEGIGSNNWVVHGTHTTTGTPLLANDPIFYKSNLFCSLDRTKGSLRPSSGESLRTSWGHLLLLYDDPGFPAT